MVSFPPCKINLGLRVISKRPDGYHNIETCFYPLPFTDVLEIVPSNELGISLTGLEIPGDPDENICLKAYQLLKKQFNIPPVRIFLHKIIPSGAGLGGGSSDGAFALKMLSEMFSPQLSKEQLSSFSSELGSDCAFFVDPKPGIGTGRGEILQPANISLAGKFLVVIIPKINLSTAEAYQGIVPGNSSSSVKEIVEHQPLDAWRGLLKNDFEEGVFRRFPALSEIKKELYEHHPIYAAMSGSGSAVYGIFNSPVDLKEKFPGMNYWSGTTEL